MHHHQLLFSIITCSLDSRKYIYVLIRSVEDQIYNNYKHIFIDGFSKDNTLQKIKKYQKRHFKSVKLFQTPAKGIGNAMNVGIEKSSGKYIIHLHSDDCFNNRFVLKNIANIINQNKNIDLVYGKAEFIDEHSCRYKIIPHRNIYHKLHYLLLLLTNYIPHQAVFIEKSVFNKYGLFREDLKNSMDYELWLRLSRKKIMTIFTDNIICNFIVRNTSQRETGNALGENIKIINDMKINYFTKKIVLFIHRLNSTRKLF